MYPRCITLYIHSWMQLFFKYKYYIHAISTCIYPNINILFLIHSNATLLAIWVQLGFRHVAHSLRNTIFYPRRLCRKYINSIHCFFLTGYAVHFPCTSLNFCSTIGLMGSWNKSMFFHAIRTIIDRLPFFSTLEYVSCEKTKPCDVVFFNRWKSMTWIMNRSIDRTVMFLSKKCVSTQFSAHFCSSIFSCN